MTAITSSSCRTGMASRRIGRSPSQSGSPSRKMRALDQRDAQRQRALAAQDDADLVVLVGRRPGGGPALGRAQEGRLAAGLPRGQRDRHPEQQVGEGQIGRAAATRRRGAAMWSTCASSSAVRAASRSESADIDHAACHADSSGRPARAVVGTATTARNGRTIRRIGRDKPHRRRRRSASCRIEPRKPVAHRSVCRRRSAAPGGDPVMRSLLVPTYSSATPRLWGFPFFYWYQLLWVLLASAFTYGAYLLVERRARERVSALASGGRASTASNSPSSCSSSSSSRSAASSPPAGGAASIDGQPGRVGSGRPGLRHDRHLVPARRRPVHRVHLRGRARGDVRDRRGERVLRRPVHDRRLPARSSSSCRGCGRSRTGAAT